MNGHGCIKFLLAVLVLQSLLRLLLMVLLQSMFSTSRTTSLIQLQNA